MIWPIKEKKEEVKAPRMFKCIGEKCTENKTKHPEKEMWLCFTNLYTINKKTCKRMCKECAKTYRGAYILEKYDDV